MPPPESLRQVFNAALSQASQHDGVRDNGDTVRKLNITGFDAKWDHFCTWLKQPARWDKGNQSRCDHGLGPHEVVTLSEHVLERTSNLLDCKSLSSHLRCMRMLMRDPSAGSVLRRPACVESFLTVWSHLQEDKQAIDTWSHQAQIEAASCVLNAGFGNPHAMEKIASCGGVRMAAEALKRGGKPMLMLCACRLLSTVLSLQGDALAAVLQQCKSENIVAMLCSLVSHASDYSFATQGMWTERILLCAEAIKTIFALGCVLPSGLKDITEPVAKQSLELLARKIPHLLDLPDALPHSADVKAATISLLLYLPPELAYQLHASQTALPNILAHLESTLRRMHSLQLFGDHSAASVAPAMVVVTQLAQFDERIRDACEGHVFPHSDTPTCGSGVQSEFRRTAGRCKMGEAASTTADDLKPSDAPRGSLRWLLIKQLTNPNRVMQSCASELLFQLCHKNSDLMVARTGLGNCMGFLHSRNLLPANFPVPAAAKSSANVA